MKQSTRRLSEGDGISLEKKSFKIIQNKTNEKTCQGFDKPYSARFGHLKGIKPRKVGILEAGKTDQTGCQGNGFNMLFIERFPFLLVRLLYFPVDIRYK